MAPAKRTMAETKIHGRLNERERCIVAVLTVGPLRQELQPACCFPDHFPRAAQMLLGRENISQTDPHDGAAA